VILGEYTKGPHLYDIFLCWLLGKILRFRGEVLFIILEHLGIAGLIILQKALSKVTNTSFSHPVLFSYHKCVRAASQGSPQ
jgi:hypothetical protein